MAAGDGLHPHGIHPVARADVANAGFVPVDQRMQAAFDPAAAGFHAQAQTVAGVILPKVKVLVAHHAPVGDLHDGAGKGVALGDEAAALEHAGDFGGRGLVGVERVLKAQGGHFHRRNGAVGQDGDLFHAGPAGHDGAVGHPVIEHVPLPVDTGDGAVIVAGGIIHAVVDDVAPVGEGAPGGRRGGVGQAAAAAGGINEIIGVAYLAGRAGLEKATLFGHVFVVGDHGMQKAARQHAVHGGGVQLVHEGFRVAVIDVHPPVVVHQHAGVVENAAVPHLIGILIGGQQAEGPLRPVRHAHRALGAHDVGIEVILAVLFHYVRRVQFMIRPGRVGGAKSAGPGAEAVAVALPVVQVA